MTQIKNVKIRLMFWLLSFIVLIVTSVSAQHGAPNGDWPYWGGDAGSTRYSALDQINKNNVQKLEIAWRWYSANYGPIPEFYFRATPLEVEGVIYTVAGERRAAVAIDAGTGETLWMWRMKNNPRWEKSPRRFSGRGLAYAEVDGEGRIIVVTPGYYMVLLDAATGQPVIEFGNSGIIDLQEGLGFKVDPVNGIDPKYGLITHGSPPIVVNDIIVVGNAHGRGYYPKQKENIPGHIRGYDIKTGKQLWIFHVIPKPGEYGHDTWEGNSWTYTGNISSWAPLSADPELNIVYIPTDCPTGDYYGGHRHGDNLYGTGLVALNVKTGKRIWHQQFVKHDIWNYDTPTAPNLLDIRVKRKKIKAIVQATKQGWAYVFDRKTGKPVWPMEERKAPASDVPGEKTSPTQRYPTWPLAFELQEITEDELIDFTPALHAQAVKLASRYRMGPIFTPPSLAEDPEDGTQGTFVMPGANGGANIPGGAVVDPETGIFYVASEKGHSVIRLVNDPEKSSMRYILGIPYRLSAGMDLEDQQDDRQRFDNLGGVRGDKVLDQLEKFRSIGAFIEEELSINKVTKVTVGGRFDGIDVDAQDAYLEDGDASSGRTFTAMSPLLGVVHTLSTGINVYSNISTSFETPTLNELSNNPEGGGGFNADLRPQLATNYEIGIKGLFKKRLKYEMALFKIDLNDELVQYELNDFPGRTFYRNAGSSKRAGIEIGLTSFIGKGLTGSTVYTFSDFTYLDFKTVDAVHDGKMLPGIPKQFGYGELSYVHSSGFYFKLQARFSGELYADDANKVKEQPYSVMNIRVGYQKRFSEWLFEPFAGINNLFGKKYNSNVRLNAWGGRYFEPASGFHIYGGVRVRIGS